MSVSVTFNNSTYTIPQFNETGWAVQVTSWIQAVSSAALSKAGGTFTLTADVDFGASFGIKSLYFKSRASNIADAGILRMANAASIGWRNAANSGNNLLAVNSSDQLTYNGTVISSSAGVTPAAAGGTGQSSYAVGDTLYASGATALSKLGIGTAGQVLRVNAGATAPEWGTVGVAVGGTGLTSYATGDLVYASGATTIAKLAVGTAGQVLKVNSGATAPEWGAAGVAGGGTGVTSYSVGDIVYASGATTISKLAIGTAGQVLKVNGGATAPTWGSAATSLAVTSKTGNYTLTSDDDLVLCDSTGGTFTLTLPAAASNTGKVFRMKKIDATYANPVTIDGNASETIDGATTQTLNTQYEELAIVSDGTNWQIIDRRIPGTSTSYSPTYGAGLGTTGNSQVFWRREGQFIFIQGRVQAGTVTGGAASFTLPTGLAVDSALIDTSRHVCGHAVLNRAASAAAVNFCTLGVVGGATNVISLTGLGDGAATNQFTATPATTLMANNSYVAFECSVPVSGWGS